MFIIDNGKRLATPLFFVIIALGTTDLLFALDSIPAIYGLTREPYIVLVANLFALMGLRQLYFLLGGLLTKLVYLSLGLAVLLAFIGVKLLLHALHENELPFINGGEKVAVPEIPIWMSPGAMVVILGPTTVPSPPSVPVHAFTGETSGPCGGSAGPSQTTPSTSRAPSGTRTRVPGASDNSLR